eukprot:364838-Chlamydomonas_euryale.AAC.3
MARPGHGQQACAADMVSLRPSLPTHPRSLKPIDTPPVSRLRGTSDMLSRQVLGPAAPCGGKRPVEAAGLPHTCRERWFEVEVFFRNAVLRESPSPSSLLPPAVCGGAVVRNSVWFGGRPTAAGDHTGGRSAGCRNPARPAVRVTWNPCGGSWDPRSPRFQTQLKPSSPQVPVAERATFPPFPFNSKQTRGAASLPGRSKAPSEATAAQPRSAPGINRRPAAEATDARLPPFPRLAPYAHRSLTLQRACQRYSSLGAAHSAWRSRRSARGGGRRGGRGGAEGGGREWRQGERRLELGLPKLLPKSRAAAPSAPSAAAAEAAAATATRGRHRGRD